MAADAEMTFAGSHSEPKERAGLTLAEAWRGRFSILGRPDVCLLASNRRDVSIDTIPHVVTLDPADFARALGRLLDREQHGDIQAFVYDGKIGHSIVLESLDSDESVVYFDPWPGESLLTRANNKAGVAAQRTGDRKWALPLHELAKVIVAAFVSPMEWADFVGVTSGVAYDQLQQSDFWTWFGFTERNRSNDRPRTVITASPQNQSKDIELKLELERDRICKGTLALQRSWIGGGDKGAFNPLSLDITASFLMTLTPEQDRPDVRPVSLELLGNGEAVETLEREKPSIANLLAALGGQRLEATAWLSLCKIRAQNTFENEEFHILVELY